MQSWRKGRVPPRGDLGWWGRTRRAFPRGVRFGLRRRSPYAPVVFGKPCPWSSFSRGKGYPGSKLQVKRSLQAQDCQANLTIRKRKPPPCPLNLSGGLFHLCRITPHNFDGKMMNALFWAYEFECFDDFLLTLQACFPDLLLFIEAQNLG